MTNRNSILGAFAWMLVASTLVFGALEPISAAHAEGPACIRSAADVAVACAVVA